MQKKNLLLLCCFGLICFTACGSKSANQTTNISETSSEIISTTDIDSQFNMLDCEYKENEDGTYFCNGKTYKYKIVVTDENDAGFLILTNNKDVSFRTVGDSMASSNSNDTPQEFVVIGMK